MDELIAQIRIASANGLYYLALWGALTLPDLCGALGSQNGKATGTKYKMWLRENVPEQREQATEIYMLRCSMMHQGRALPKGSTAPMAFTAPGGPQLHNFSIESPEGDRIGLMSIEFFVQEVTDAAELWLKENGASRQVKDNLEKFARFRPGGLPPYLGGPLIA